ncbi:MAG: hypothetical protein J07HQX50_00384 [Haloquadratum sp. J07HQX50]|nr:MAG: hypothetical protein J07HQX50_00384 [Haloquadratum sp. J07HQX50]
MVDRLQAEDLSLFENIATPDIAPVLRPPSQGGAVIVVWVKCFTDKWFETHSVIMRTEIFDFNRERPPLGLFRRRVKPDALSSQHSDMVRDSVSSGLCLLRRALIPSGVLFDR